MVCTCRDTWNTESLITISRLIYGIFVFEHFPWKLILWTWIFTPDVLTPHAKSVWLVPIHFKRVRLYKSKHLTLYHFLSIHFSDKILPKWQILLKGQCVWSPNTTFWKRMRVISFHNSMDLYTKNWRNPGGKSFSPEVCGSVVITLTT